jgi:hypothetical protein
VVKDSYEAVRSGALVYIYYSCLCDYSVVQARGTKVTKTWIDVFYLIASNTS